MSTKTRRSKRVVPTGWFKKLFDLWAEAQRADDPESEDDQAWEAAHAMENAIAVFRNPETVGDVLDWPQDPSPDSKMAGWLKRAGLRYLIERDQRQWVDDATELSGWDDVTYMEHNLLTLLESDPGARDMDGAALCDWIDEKFPEGEDTPVRSIETQQDSPDGAEGVQK